MLFIYRRVNKISVVPALAMVASVAILAGVAAIIAVVVAAARGTALLRGIGAMRPAKNSVFQDHATIEAIVVHTSEIADQRT
jgi:hypothetical protein